MHSSPSADLALWKLREGDAGGKLFIKKVPLSQDLSLTNQLFTGSFLFFDNSCLQNLIFCLHEHQIYSRRNTLQVYCEFVFSECRILRFSQKHLSRNAYKSQHI